MPREKLTSVFVSSTSIDLEGHRKAVCESLRQGGFLVLAMEDFGSRDDHPRDECLRMISDETDYFIGIYAHRYGFIPQGSNISITEEEYHAAGNAGIERLIYIVDRNMPWVPDHIERGEPAEKLAQFIGLLGSRHIRKTFTSPDNLAKSVMADLGRIQIRRFDKGSSDSGDALPWTKERPASYESNRYINLVHVFEPSEKEGQEYDILIYLFRHRANSAGSPLGIEDVKKAEFYLGPAWNDRVFTCENSGVGRYIGIKVSAYGTFLCLCRVTFDDDETILLERYIDFEAEPIAITEIKGLTRRG